MVCEIGCAPIRFYDNAGMDIGTEEEQPTDTFLDTEVRVAAKRSGGGPLPASLCPARSSPPACEKRS